MNVPRLSQCPRPLFWPTPQLHTMRASLSANRQTHNGQRPATSTRLAMKKQLCLMIVALASTIGIAAAEDFDGARPMQCEALEGHDCLPNQSSCKPLEAKKDKELKVGIDVTAKTMKTPYRNDLLPIQRVTKNKE